MKKEVKEEKEELFIPKTKHKGLKITITIILIATIIVGCYFLYQYKFNNPKTIVNNILDDAKENINKSLVTDIGDDKYKVDGYIKIDANLGNESNEMIDLLKDLELGFSGEIDPNNSIGNITINTKYKNDKLIDIKTYYENNITYLLLDGIYDKYLKIDGSDDQEFDLTKSLPSLDINPKDMQALFNAIIDSLKEEIDKLDIKKEDATITIDGKEIDVIDNYIEFQDKEFNDFAKNIINNLKENKDFTSILKKLTNSDVDDTLDNMINDITGDSFQGIYKINFYTDKSLFNKKIVSVRQTIAQSGATITITVDKIAEDEIEVSLAAMGVVYSIRVKKNSSVLNVSLAENVMGMYFKVELNMTYEKIKELTKPDLSDSKNINDLTESEQKQIEENLVKNKNLERFYKELTKSDEKEV